MRNLVLLLAAVIILGILGYYIIQWFRIPDPALIIFGVLLLTALILGAFKYWPGSGEPL